MAKQLPILEKENVRLKKMVASQITEVDCIASDIEPPNHEVSIDRRVFQGYSPTGIREPARTPRKSRRQ
ncbi:MAG: hypothetical protein ACR2OA_03810 [Rubripirellula sp.]